MSEVLEMVEHYKRTLLETLVARCTPEAQDRFRRLYPIPPVGVAMDSALKLVERTLSAQAGMGFCVQRLPALRPSSVSEDSLTPKVHAAYQEVRNALNAWAGSISTKDRAYTALTVLYNAALQRKLTGDSNA